MESKFKYKLVVKDRLTTDEHLVGLYETDQMAVNAMARIPQAIRDQNEYNVKAVDPWEIMRPVDTDYSHYVWSLIPKEEQQRVLKSDSIAELCPDCLMCGGDTYYNLSRMIPKNFLVIDIGAGYGAQSYLFQEHKGYVAVEPFPNVIKASSKDDMEWHLESFRCEGTRRYNITAGNFLQYHLKKVLQETDTDISETFAICNYVPDWHHEKAGELVRHNFENCYVFYPHSKTVF